MIVFKVETMFVVRLYYTTEIFMYKIPRGSNSKEGAGTGIQRRQHGGNVLYRYYKTKGSKPDLTRWFGGSGGWYYIILL